VGKKERLGATKIGVYRLRENESQVYKESCTIRGRRYRKKKKRRKEKRKKVRGERLKQRGEYQLIQCWESSS